ncbi:transglycosylase SLT domain-containing protein [Pseudofulvimonas gallinarii]|jgi:membrane-bound lytic murein transglycosylase D|uniref:Membrane-bound lytic murein transglycosylase D n=1 Tax=Pseudofulvimonas gallinarii TaxID=634155 RepID=A0A4R3LSZ6_9GAMM|nr:transglycosylase SLT domain-containing protein [Pseudofulvimonas gallinarii]TCT01397.1 membrane-bound lytic murein transglycosylase D [Pseudofulvimonas gallinarii]
MRRTSLSLMLSLVLSGCATVGGGTGPGDANGNGNGDRETAALYNRLNEAVQRFAAGTEAMVAGDAEGQKERDAALESLRVDAERCLQVRACEASRFVAAYDALIRNSAMTPLPEDRPSADPAQIEADALSPVLADLPEAQRTITLLRGRDLAEVIELNEPVKAAINEWLTWLRPNLVEAYENYQYMRYMMWPQYEQAGLPEALLFAIMARESQGKVHAVSRSGAAGPLQFMPATGQRFGLGRRPVDGFDTRFDPREATRAQVAYLNEQFDRLNNNLELVVAAYNGGEGRLQRLSGGGQKSLWDPAVFGALPQETQIYVPMVLAAAYLFLHPEQYGLEFPRLDTRPAVVRLEKAASINELTVCLGHAGGNRVGWFRALRNLNPQYDNARVLPAGTQLEVPALLVDAYHRQCVDGPLVALASELNTARMPVSAPSPARQVMSGSAPSSGRVHTVRSGETLYAIARRYSCSMQGLAAQNGIRGPNYPIRPGQKIRLC